MRELQHPPIDELELSAVLVALSDPSRREILSILLGGPRRCGSFELPLAKSTISHHCRVLREAGLIHVEVDGNSRTASLRRNDIDTRFPGLLAAVNLSRIAAAG